MISLIPARVDQPYLLRYRSSTFLHYFNNLAMTCRKYRGNTISVKRWKRRTRNHHKHKRQEREIIYSLLATSCGLYFTRAANLARACSSLAGDPWRRLFFVLVPQSTFYLSVLLRHMRNLKSNSTTCTTPHVCQRRFHKISAHKSHTVCTWYGGEALTIAFIFIP